MEGYVTVARRMHQHPPALPLVPLLPDSLSQPRNAREANDGLAFRQRRTVRPEAPVVEHIRGHVRKIAQGTSRYRCSTALRQVEPLALRTTCGSHMNLLPRLHYIMIYP